MGKRRWIACKDENSKEFFRHRRTTLREEWLAFLRKLKPIKCEICGYDKCKAALDFHHTDKSTKLFSISQFIAVYPLTRENRVRVFDEMQKCILLCSNCHRELHHANRE